ncbi:MAG: ATP-dependent 6-phosphofructokinase [Rariglobus sp.]
MKPKLRREDFEIRNLGKATHASPLAPSRGDTQADFVSDDRHRVLFDHSFDRVAAAMKGGKEPKTIERSGPRRKVFFDPKKSRAAIVGCGGLCPGINDVVRGLVMTLNFSYGVKTVFGIPYGFEGFIDTYGHRILELTPDLVSDIHTQGGSILGTSRGPQPMGQIVDKLLVLGVNMLFVIGGDGTLRGASEIVKEITKRKLQIAVVCVPKTIDNDLEYMDKTFGFETASAEAVRVIRGAHNEAAGAPRGVGLVKVMGRDSGFIAAFASLADNCANFVLIPESPFRLEGPGGLFEHVEKRLAERGHAVVVVAEGAGQDLMKTGKSGKDASGNDQLEDIGPFLKERIQRHFKRRKLEASVKYIDPSYVIRSVPAGAQDSVYCLRLAQHAVHAAMAGKTDMVVARWHGHHVNLPIQVVTVRRRKVDLQGDLWMSVLEATGQPARFGP